MLSFQFSFHVFGFPLLFFFYLPASCWKLPHVPWAWGRYANKFCLFSKCIKMPFTCQVPLICNWQNYIKPKKDKINDWLILLTHKKGKGIPELLNFAWMAGLRSPCLRVCVCVLLSSFHLHFPLSVSFILSDGNVGCRELQVAIFGPLPPVWKEVSSWVEKSQGRALICLASSLMANLAPIRGTQWEGDIDQHFWHYHLVGVWGAVL